MRRWGIDFRAGEGLLRLAPQGPGEVPEHLGPFRAGRTVVRLVLRRRPAAMSLRLAVTFGPPIRVVARLADPDWAVPAEVDGVPLGRAEVGFEASGEHEIIWRR